MRRFLPFLAASTLLVSCESISGDNTDDQADAVSGFTAEEAQEVDAAAADAAAEIDASNADAELQKLEDEIMGG